MTLEQRKAIELERKLDSLVSELQKWRDLSEASKPPEEPKPFEKHHSQLRRISSQLEGAQDAIRKAIQHHARMGTLLAFCRDLEVCILDLHSVWDFFRAKLALRAVPFYACYLVPADELAWKCYEPARSRAHAASAQAQQLKEPPLVFFDAWSTPYARSRFIPYEEPDENRRRWAVKAQHLPLIKSLPIPVIGVPWFQARHLSDTLLLAHEAGHVVEHDFGLTSTLHQLLGTAGVPGERHAAWASWLGEVFADVYGCLSLGPAFVGALMDFLAMDPQDIMAQRPDSSGWGDYPTDFLRILLGLRVLEVMGFQEKADAYRKEWLALYPRHAMGQEFEEDIPRVVDALLTGPIPELGKVSLCDVLCFSAVDQRNAASEVTRLLRAEKPGSSNVRVLLAAARLAYEKDPGAYVAGGVEALVLQKIEKDRESGPRNSPTGAGAKEAKALEAADREAGARLFGWLTLRIGPYVHEPVVCRPHDPRSAEVARRVGEAVRHHLPGVTVEHIGSTSVQGCEGKGVVDLMIPVMPGQLEPVKAVLDALGFQKQVPPAGHEPWPEDRPMRQGSLEHEGTRYNLHVHVIPADSPEVETQRRFRDQLRGDPAKREAYVARKRELLAQGITNSGDYAEAKGTVIERILKGSR
ncbi:GrpB family protein [Archangium minus]|uniref:GrpB family protein n=1 Tax=Archangium minus TaxID=83450 RepID=A0ABY9WNA5_9BACT|nr:GrpB family protein [Archangium minus]